MPCNPPTRNFIKRPGRQIGVSLTELQSLKAWLEDTNPPRHKVVAAVGLGQKIADLVKDFECNMKGFCKELEGAHADAGRSNN